jgi:hypothetical protein
LDGPKVVLDINQPGEEWEEGVYREGKIVGRVGDPGNDLPEGTLLYGQLWTEQIFYRGKDAVYARYTEALLPDGDRFPICLVLANRVGLFHKLPGSKPGEARLNRALPSHFVDYWP